MRPTVAGDVPALVALVDAVAAEGRWLLVRPGQRTATEEHLLLAQLAGAGGLSLSLEVAGEVAGRVMVAPEAHAGGRAAGEVAILLAAGLRGQGLGRVLLSHAVAWSQGSGLHLLRLRVLPDNAPAIALYRSLGFVDAGIDEHPPTPAGARRGELLTMTLELPGPGARPLLSSAADE